VTSSQDKELTRRPTFNVELALSSRPALAPDTVVQCNGLLAARFHGWPEHVMRYTVSREESFQDLGLDIQLHKTPTS